MDGNEGPGFKIERRRRNFYEMGDEKMNRQYRKSGSDTTLIRLRKDHSTGWKRYELQRRTDGTMGCTKVTEWPLIFPNQIVAGCDTPVQQRGDLEPLFDMTHKTNGQGRSLGANHTKETRKVLNKEQRVKTQKLKENGMILL